MSEQDRIRWDAAYVGAEPQDAKPPAAFTAYTDVFPTTGTALDLACGAGAGSIWLARRGLRVLGVDVSAVALERARASAVHAGVADRCRFEVVDLDAGLPSGPPVDVLLCHRFRDPQLYPQIIERLSARGLLAICVLSEVGAAPGRFRAPPRELHAAFSGLEVIAAHERSGEAWLLARLPADRDVGDVGVVPE